MEVILASCGNPDHYQDPYQPMWGCEDNRKVEVESIEEAVEICLEFIKRNDLGGGNWIGGQVLSNKKFIAQIVLSGKTFFPGDKFFEISPAYRIHKLHEL